MTARYGLYWAAGFLLAVILGFSWLGKTPLFGDEIGYGYTASSWIARNSMELVPSGSERGEQAMGHPAMYFWLWAALMKLFGDTLTTARILPVLFTGFSLVGVWKLGTLLGKSPRVGVMAVLGLIASPLFLAQTLRTLPTGAHLACIAWALVFYMKDKRVLAALLVAGATVARLQGVFLGPALLVADLIRFRRLRWEMLLWLSPLVVILVTGLMNLSVNGYFFFPAHFGENVLGSDYGWIFERLRLFMGHLVGEDFRWFPVSLAIASTLLFRKAGKPGLLFILCLSLPALFHPHTRLIVVIGLPLLYCVGLLVRRTLPTPAVTAMLIFTGLLVLFQVFVVAMAPDSTMNQFRYLYGAYAPLYALSAAGVYRLGRRVSLVLWLLFCGLSLSCVTTVRYVWQSEATVAGLEEARAIRTAIGSTENPYVPYSVLTDYPALGYVSEPLITNLHDTTFVIISSMDIPAKESLLPPGYSYTGRAGYQWQHQGLSVVALEAVPIHGHP